MFGERLFDIHTVGKTAVWVFFKKYLLDGPRSFFSVGSDSVAAHLAALVTLCCVSVYAVLLDFSVHFYQGRFQASNC